MNLPIKSPSRLFIAICCVLAMSLEFTGCSDDPTNPGLVAVKTNSTLGDFLTDGNGKTLYIFSNDVSGQSLCTGNCLADWPVYYASNLKPSVGVDAADFATITRTDGKQQTTYKGWPLYYFAGDHASGDVSGEAVGNIWFVAKPGGYSLMLGNGQLVGKDGKSYTSTYTEGTGATEYLVDANGRTLYMFSKDFNGVNKFTNGDATHNAIWPIFYTEVETLPSTLSKDDFGEISVFGNDQLTYKGHPLYYFGEDANAGETKGVSQGLTNGVPTWPVLNAQTAVAPGQPTVVTATAGFLTDNLGRSLYYFAKDITGIAVCTGDCQKTWPIFNADHILLASGSTLNASDFAFIGDGATRQTTYKGRPLYYYSKTNDGVIQAAGLTDGDGIGTVWFLARPDYALMVGHNGTTRYLTDAAGRTLYLHSPDKNGVNNFSTGVADHDANWPNFFVTINGTTKLPAGMTASDFGAITVFGNSQLTYRGWPMYYFKQDVAKGDAKGVSATWPMATSATTVAPN
jgi:predicted lipoprotein with Yx(FWY)xxD motif